MMRTPDGHGRVELTKFHAPAAVRAEPKNAPANALGIRRIMFAVEDIDDVLVRLLGAIFFARFTLHAGLFTTPQGTGLDYNLLILAGCITLIAFGAGGWSLDAIRKKALAQAAL